MPEVDETELGDDPFATGGGGGGLDSGNELWLKSDRDYTYEEVCSRLPVCFAYFADSSQFSFFTGSTASCTHPTPHCSRPQGSGTRLRRPKFCVKVTRSPSSRMSPTSASVCIASPSTSSSICLRKWVPPALSTVPAVSLSRVASSKSRSRTCSGVTSVCYFTRHISTP